MDYKEYVITFRNLSHEKFSCLPFMGRDAREAKAAFEEQYKNTYFKVLSVALTGR